MSNRVVGMIIAVLLISMAHFLRGEPADYLIALTAIGFIISSIYSQGIGEEGMLLLLPLALPWLCW